MTDRSPTLLKRWLGGKNFGLVLGLLVFALVGWAAFGGLTLFSDWDRSLSDLYFRYRDITTPTLQQEGAVLKKQDDHINPDLLILGVDNRSLDTLGKWPFAHSLHADLLNTFSRIQDQSQRERAVFFDFFFLDKEPVPENDLAFAAAIAAHGRVALETVYSSEPMDADLAEVQFHRLEVLNRRVGTFGSVEGDWKGMEGFLSIQAPLIPLAAGAQTAGFATLPPDPSDGVIRRQNLISKVSQVVGEYESTTLKADLSDYDRRHQRYVYLNKAGRPVTLPAPLTDEVLRGLPELLARDGLTRQVQDEGSDQVRTVYRIQKVQDLFLPSITLVLALDYWHKTLADVQVVLGSHILVPRPELHNAETGTWAPAPVSEVRIPIDGQGAMAINFRGQRSSENGGEYQTYPVRSYSSYATRAPSANPADWPESRQVAGKLLLVGPFSSGVADDEKVTPFGQMFGVEIHANALNTILTQNFLHPVPTSLALAILLVVTLLVSFLASRFSTLWSLALTLVLLVAGLWGALELFDATAWVYPYSSFFTAALLTFLVVVAYRALTEEREKRRVKGVFSKFVSPEVVTELLKHPPELGGVDKELTVLFSDIRGFTSLSEGMAPQELVNHLNLYLTAMTDVIHEYRGTLDKYVGDEIMCFWGAPLDQPDHAVLAAQCALRMIEVLDEMNAQWPANRQIKIGIGLNSGVMTVGNMGSLGRMNYTLMGDNVNLGARLEGTNKIYRTQIILSENTYLHIEDRAIVRELDTIRVQGKRKPVLIYELLDFGGGLAPSKGSRRQ